MSTRERRLESGHTRRAVPHNSTADTCLLEHKTHYWYTAREANAHQLAHTWTFLQRHLDQNRMHSILQTVQGEKIQSWLKQICLWKKRGRRETSEEWYKVRQWQRWKQIRSIPPSKNKTSSNPQAPIAEWQTAQSQLTFRSKQLHQHLRPIYPYRQLSWVTNWLNSVVIRNGWTIGYYVWSSVKRVRVVRSSALSLASIGFVCIY